MWYGPITFVPLTQDIAPLVVGGRHSLKVLAKSNAIWEILKIDKITGNSHDQLPFGDAGVMLIRLTPAVLRVREYSPSPYWRECFPYQWNQHSSRSSRSWCGFVRKSRCKPSEWSLQRSPVRTNCFRAVTGRRCNSPPDHSMSPVRSSSSPHDAEFPFRSKRSRSLGSSSSSR